MNDHRAHAREEDEMDTDRVRAIVRHRCPELSQDDIAKAFAADLPVESIWLEISERVIDAIDALDERLATLERTINGGQDDDDDERVRGQASGRN